MVTPELVKLGIPPLDDLLGGVPRGYLIMVHGPSGSGKTELVFQFLLGGVRRGEKAVVILTVGSARSVLRSMGLMGVDVRRYVEEGLLKVVEVSSPFDEEELRAGFYEFMNVIEETGAKRIAVDSVDPFFRVLGVPEAMEMVIGVLRSKVEETGAVALLTSTTALPQTYAEVATYCHGVLRMEWSPIERERRIVVEKMRGVEPRAFSVQFQMKPGAGIVRVEMGPPLTARRCLTTGVEGLDRLLGGGLPAGSVNLVWGDPGSGRTALGVWFAVKHASSGVGSCIISLTDPVEDLRDVVRAFGHDPEAIGVGLHHVSPEEAQDIPDLMRGCTAVFIDGLEVLQACMETYDLYKFQREVQKAAKSSGAVVLESCAPPTFSRSSWVLASLADALIELKIEERDHRIVRTIRVLKTKFRPAEEVVGVLEVRPSGLEVIF